MFSNLFKNKKPLIGVIHLPALPGYKDHVNMEYVINKGLKDLHTLEQAGFDGVLVENDGDHRPYLEFNKQITESFTTVIQILKKENNIPLGMEILYDLAGTVKTAYANDIDFVRLDTFVDDVMTNYGELKAPNNIIQRIISEHNTVIPILADIHVKHTTMIDKNKTITQSALEAMDAQAAAIIITGTWTGKEPDLTDCIEAKSTTHEFPVLIGSGLTRDNAEKLLTLVDGAIVGTSIKTGVYIDGTKAKELVDMVQKIRAGL